jgi:hypothetical protein
MHVMRASLLCALALLSVSFSGCYSNGGWHAPNWDRLAWWKAPKTEAPSSPSMMAGGPHIAKPSETAMAGDQRPANSALPLTPSSPNYGGAQTSYTNTYPNTGAPPVNPYASAGPAARTADASTGYPSGSRYDGSNRDLTQRGSYDGTYQPSARIQSAQPAPPSYRDYGAPETNPYATGERKAAADSDPGRNGGSERYGAEPAPGKYDGKYDANPVGGRYEPAPSPRDTDSSLRYDSRENAIGKTGYEPGNTGYEPPQQKSIDRADYANQSNVGGTSNPKRDAQYQPGGTGRYSGSTNVADRSGATPTERGSTYSERYGESYGQPVDDRRYERSESRYDDEYRGSGANRY